MTIKEMINEIDTIRNRLCEWQETFKPECEIDDIDYDVIYNYIGDADFELGGLKEYLKGRLPQK